MTVDEARPFPMGGLFLIREIPREAEGSLNEWKSVTG
jgi:hypothetical protein